MTGLHSPSTKTKKSPRTRKAGQVHVRLHSGSICEFHGRNVPHSEGERSHSVSEPGNAHDCLETGSTPNGERDKTFPIKGFHPEWRECSRILGVPGTGSRGHFAVPQVPYSPRRCPLRPFRCPKRLRG